MRLRKSLVLVFMSLCALACNNAGVSYVHKTQIIPDVNIIVNLKDIERHREMMLSSLFETMKKESEEMLPFDEPIHEYGFQLDGSLRPRWENAYKNGRRRFAFNGDWYYTVTKNSAPFVPQVCADFIVDTIDRTAGTWYVPSLKNPRRIIGRFDMRNDMIDKGFDPRRASDLIIYFHKHPEKFEVIYSGHDEEGPRTGNTIELQNWLKSKDVRLGDIIMIKGRAPWDHGKEMHHHSLFVSSLDKDGKVEKVFGNPAYPVDRTIKAEMSRAPRRHVIEIVRLTNNFLKNIIGES